uniref:Putative secreted protein n=1 Tax=Ixodes ricinus TaxID=34613 RepID=A0A6B0UZT6_IXORI
MAMQSGKCDGTQSSSSACFFFFFFFFGVTGSGFTVTCSSSAASALSESFFFFFFFLGLVSSSTSSAGAEGPASSSSSLNLRFFAPEADGSVESAPGWYCLTALLCSYRSCAALPRPSPLIRRLPPPSSSTRIRVSSFARCSTPSSVPTPSSPSASTLVASDALAASIRDILPLSFCVLCPTSWAW